MPRAVLGEKWNMKYSRAAGRIHCEFVSLWCCVTSKKCQNLCHVKSIKEKEHLDKSKFPNFVFASISNFHATSERTIMKCICGIDVNEVEKKWTTRYAILAYYMGIFERTGIRCVAKNENNFYFLKFSIRSLSLTAREMWNGKGYPNAKWIPKTHSGRIGNLVLDLDNI